MTSQTKPGQRQACCCFEAPSGISAEYCQPDTHSRRTVICFGPLIMPSHKSLTDSLSGLEGKRRFNGSCEALSEFKKSFVSENSAKLKGTGPPRSSPGGFCKCGPTPKGFPTLSCLLPAPRTHPPGGPWTKVKGLPYLPDHSHLVPGF